MTTKKPKRGRRTTAGRTESAVLRIMTQAGEREWKRWAAGLTRAALLDEVRFLVEFIGYWRLGLRDDPDGAKANEMTWTTLGRSPDRADALAMAWAATVDACTVGGEVLTL